MRYNSAMNDLFKLQMYVSSYVSILHQTSVLRDIVFLVFILKRFYTEKSLAKVSGERPGIRKAKDFDISEKLCLGTLNVSGLTCKETELIKELEYRKDNTIVLT